MVRSFRSLQTLLTKKCQVVTSSKLMVEVSGLTKYYGAVCAIQEVSFIAQRGEIVGLLGPNGAGKTTTMRIITGFMAASEGAVNVDGFDVSQESQEVRRRIGYLPENPPLYYDMTVSSYLKFVGRIKGVPGKEIPGDRTVILSTHILPEVSQICNKVVIINEGRVVVEKNLEELTQGATLEEVFLRYIAKEGEEEKGGEEILLL